MPIYGAAKRKILPLLLLLLLLLPLLVLLLQRRRALPREGEGALSTHVVATTRDDWHQLFWRRNMKKRERPKKK
jgi:hypothetical protein